MSMVLEQSWAAIVAYYDSQAAAPRFRQYFGQLFGYPTLSLPSTATLRFFSAAMASMYFDDLSVQDWTFGKESAQSFCCGLALQVGSKAKHQQMAAQSDFLVLPMTCSMSRTLVVRFWVRPQLIDKVRDIVG